MGIHATGALCGWAAPPALAPACETEWSGYPPGQWRPRTVHSGVVKGGLSERILRQTQSTLQQHRHRFKLLGALARPFCPLSHGEAVVVAVAAPNRLELLCEQRIHQAHSCQRRPGIPIVPLSHAVRLLAVLPRPGHTVGVPSPVHTFGAGSLRRSLAGPHRHRAASGSSRPSPRPRHRRGAAQPPPPCSHLSHQDASPQSRPNHARLRN